METVLSDNQGTTESMKILRDNITSALANGHTVVVKLLQPGVMYHHDNDWKTVIDFMNEWQGMPVSFQSNLVPIKECKVKFTYTNDMFFTGPKLYQQNEMCRGLLAKLSQEKTGDKKWDLLLGEQSANKDLLHSMIKQHPVLENTFLTYFGKDTSGGHWSEHVVRPKKHTAETLGPLANRFNTQIRCSDLIDPEIYNQTWYTAMIETTIHNDFAMFSEKEAKPIVAKRPFIIFGACRQLEALRSLGFKTFFEVVDESYDLIEDKQQRWRKALDSMYELAKLEPRAVYESLRQVLEHNKKHFENSEWQRCLNWDSYQ
jgi:hypothetical protein